MPATRDAASMRTGQDVPEAIAVVGMACRFSGIAASPNGLWQMLSKGLTGWSKSASSRFRMESFWHPEADLSGSFNARGLHLIKEDPALFDNSFFGISNIEAKAIDPQQRMLLEVAYEAFEDAGIPLEALRGSDTGVYCGVSNHDYEKILGRDPELSPRYRFTGTGIALVSNRISYIFDLHGPSITLDTACSSGLVAVHEACKAIRTGEVTQALVGGANLILDPDLLTVMSSMQVLSSHGRCYSFDSRADGFGRGEGIAAVMLKSLKQAIQDGDAIRGVIRGSCVMQDGHTPGITMPSSEMQLKMIEKAYRLAKLDPKDTPYVEAHGTGTVAGDKIEARAIKDAFCKDRNAANKLFVGSVKSNIGHTESVAGLAGLIKSILMLERNMIPPNPTFAKPSEAIPLDLWNIEVPKQLLQWPNVSARRISINSFGVGGTNAHVIIEAFDPTSHEVLRNESMPLEHYATSQLNFNGSLFLDDHRQQVMKPFHSPQLFVLSHDSETGVGETAANFSHYISNDRDFDNKNLSSLAYTLAHRRSFLPYRSFVIASSPRDLVEALNSQNAEPIRAARLTIPHKLCFAFTGQGAQWAGMARELQQTSPVFAHSMRQSGEYLLEFGADWSLLVELYRPTGSSRINDASLSQPCCTAIQIALVDLLRSWNVLPSVVVGHSSGEIAAAYAIGALTARDAMKAAYYRGDAVKILKSQHCGLRGAMLAVGLSAVEVEKHLSCNDQTDQVVIACINSPSSVTLSGDEAAIEIVQQKLTDQDIFNRRLMVDVAYHSHHMKLVEKQYMKAMGCIALDSQATAPMISSVTGEAIDSSALDGSYWCSNLVSPVRFSEALSEALKTVENIQKNGGKTTIVEIGPHSALAGPIKQSIKAAHLVASVDYLSVLSRNEDATITALTLAGHLFSRGVDVNFHAVNDPWGHASKDVMPNLPKYSWSHKMAFWNESRRSVNYRHRKFPKHELLGVMSDDSIPEEPTWRNYIRVQDLPWLAGHRIGEQLVFPGAGYVSMVLEALKQKTLIDGHAWKHLRINFRQISFGRALIISEEDTDGSEIFLNLRPYTYTAKESSKSWKEFRIFSLTPSGESNEHCRGLVTATCLSAQAAASQRATTNAKWTPFIEEAVKSSRVQIDAQKLYKDLKGVGMEYSGIFANCGRLAASPSSASYEVTIPDVPSIMPSNFQQPHCLHPATLDMCFQSSVASMKLLEVLGATVVPSTIENLEISSEIPSHPGELLTVRSKLRKHGHSKLAADIAVSGVGHAEQDIFLTISGLIFGNSGGPLEQGVSRRPPGESLFHRLEWSIDPTLSTPEAISKRCPAASSQSGLNAFFEKFSRIAIRKTLAAITPEDEVNIRGHFREMLRWLKSNDSDSGEDTLYDHSFEEKVRTLGVRGEVLVDIAPHLPGVLRGQVDPLALLLENDRLYRVYTNEVTDRCHEKLAQYVKLQQFKNPNMRILEIGAGTASTAVPVLEALHENKNCSGRPKLDSYTFTDISTAFFQKAEERLEMFSDIVEYKRLDIEGSPQEQGFELGAYDLIIAVNVIHATRDIDQTLRNVRSLLKPNGQFALLELTVPRLHIGLIFGMLPGWWLGAEGGRTNSPLLSASSWNDHLEQCGFTGVDVELRDYQSDADHDMSVMISTATTRRTNSAQHTGMLLSRIETSDSISVPSGDSDPGTGTPEQDSQSRGTITPVTTPSTSMLELNPNRIVHVIGGSDELPIADQLEAIFNTSANGFWAKKQALSCAEPARGHSVICLLEARGSFLETCSRTEWQSLQQIFTNASGILWVTCGATIESSHPKRSLITGLSRCLRSENHSMKFVSLDLETNKESDFEIAEHISKMFHWTLGNQAAPAASLQEWEYAIRDGEVLIPRLVEDNATNSYVLDSVSTYHPREEAGIQTERALALKVHVPGLLDSLYWADSTKHSRELRSDEVRVKLDFVSLNFKDIMTAMGELDGHTALLLEGTGRVIDVGDNLRHQFTVGESVYCFDSDGLATISNVRGSNVHRIPGNMTSRDTAAVGLAYATALYALTTIGHLQKGESILIHSAAGAVGQAAIALAQHFGAGEIFVTVGSDEKQKLLRERFGIRDENMFSSRTVDFADEILYRTNGQGVDVVLNSLAGEMLFKSIELLAPFGRFVEIGKKDLISNARLEMRSLEKNTSFSTIDLTLLERMRPHELNDIFVTLFDLLAQKTVKIIGPITVKPVNKVEESFRMMQTGKHVGKLLLELDPESNLRVQPPKPPTIRLKGDCSYLVVGGTGGLGKATIRHLARLGAKRIVTLSRSGLDNKASRELVQEMRGEDVEVSVYQGSVLDMETLKLVKEKSAQWPIKGIVQGAMVLQDSRVDSMSFEQWRNAVEPKVMGTWNLHETFGSCLDFFILLSSGGGVIGSYGQGNYCAGNTFQDAFARYRSSLRLAGRSIDVGFVEGEGYTAESQAAAEFVVRQGVRAYKLREYLATIDEAIQNPIAKNPAKAQLLCGISRADPTSQAYDTTLQRPDLKFSHIWTKAARHGNKRVDRGRVDIQSQLRSATSSEEVIAATQEAMKLKLSRLLAVPVDDIRSDRSVSSYGMDSLIAVELRNWITTELEAQVQMFELMSSMSFGELSLMIAKRTRLVAPELFSLGK